MLAILDRVQSDSGQSRTKFQGVPLVMRAFEQFAIRYTSDGKLQIIDQRLLPDEEKWITATNYKDMYTFIKRLSTRGAPMIGVAASMALAQEASSGASYKELLEMGEYLKSARPTAVNLMHCVDKLLDVSNEDFSVERLVTMAYDILQQEIDMNQKLASYGASLVNEGDGILTHCNTGSLATPGVGTALGVIRECHRLGKKIHVYVDETRPLLQGGRLTAYELQRENIPYTLICDNMAATLMRAGKIQRIFVGCDRIAVNGDFANKIGTYGLAVLAAFHKIPFHPVAPVTTLDLKCSHGDDIDIEQRRAIEVQGVCGSFGDIRWAPAQSPVFNPAFDVTPNELVTSLILDTGIYTSKQVKEGALLPKATKKQKQ